MGPLSPCLASLLSSAGYVRRPRRTRAHQLTARTGDGKSTYIGQRIPLELSFTGPDNKRYEINTATGDASGRMTYEAI